MQRAFGWLYRNLEKRYFLLFGAFELGSVAIITLATVGLFSLYEDMSAGTFWRVVLVAEGWVALAALYTIWRTRGMALPLVRWVEGGRDPADAPAAWRRAVALPRQVIAASGWQPYVLAVLPIAAYVTWELELPWYSAAVIFGATMVAVAYAAVLHFFVSEMFLRPLIEDITAHLPEDWSGQPVGVPLRWKLLGSLPLINVITGVVVSGLSADATASLEDLGVDVLVAVLVAFTISLELTLLVTRSVLGPVDDLLGATDRVKCGDLDVRVPVTSGDELGRLAGSFNEMMEGLSERERLRNAFGSYVDPSVAARVLEEGELLEGAEAEATLLFVDIRDFTPLAERSSASETVALLNEFFSLTVPILLEHGGHANKFLGDGLLGVFGAPQLIGDHADRALAAACHIAAAVEERFSGRIAIGAGLNSGLVVVGSVGGGGRLEFTVIGDAVNVAARVEAATRETGDTVLITEATRTLLERPEAVRLEPRGALPLKGKSDPIRLYAATGVDARPSTGRDPLIAEA